MEIMDYGRFFLQILYGGNVRPIWFRLTQEYLLTLCYYKVRVSERLGAQVLAIVTVPERYIRREHGSNWHRHRTRLTRN